MSSLPDVKKETKIHQDIDKKDDTGVKYNQEEALKEGENDEKADNTVLDTPEMKKELPMDDYLLELMTIAYEALEEKAPVYLEMINYKTLALYLFNRVNTAIKTSQQIYHKLIQDSAQIKDPKERQMAQMIAKTDSHAEMERILTKVPEEYQKKGKVRKIR